MTTSIIKTITTLAFLIIPAIVAGQGIAEENETETHMPSFSELAEGWNTMKPGGETSCAHGTEYEFYARAGDPSKLLVYLYGGGICFDAEGCAEGSGHYSERIEPRGNQDSFRGFLGIGDPDHPDNPFREHTMVFIPYCTGDVHMGNRDHEYELQENDGTTRVFTIRHRGQINAGSTLEWIHQNMPDLREIFVSGLSAGGIATPFYANRLARAYPDARVVGLGDGVGAFSSRDDALRPDPEDNPARWGFPDAVRMHPGWEEFPEQSGIQDLNILAAREMPNLRLYQVDHANDANQLWWFRQLGFPDPNLRDIFRSHRSEIRSEVPAFRVFILGGHEHGVLVSQEFYRKSVGNVALRDWTAAIATGVEVPDMICEDCLRPGFIFDEDDLAIINALISRLSEPDSWNPNDEEGPCPDDAKSWSLRCAVSDVVREIMDQSPGNYPVALDIINEAVIRTSYDRERGSSFPAIRLYNNGPGRTQADILDLLEAVRERIVAGLSLSRAQGAASSGLNAPASGEATEKYKATIRRTAYGVAHIEAEDLAGLGFGDGYAQAEDHLCSIADQIVRARGERAKYFGRGEADEHLANDLTMRVLRVHERAAEDLALQPAELREWAEGFAAGYNHYLEQTGRDAVPGWCRGAEWVQPATAQDFAAIWRSRLAILPRLQTQIALARPPEASADGLEGASSGASPADLNSIFDTGTGASNGWALGRELTENERGMLFANPHYAWYGADRFWEKHLRIPGELDVYGMSAIGGIGVLIGFNEAVGWTHTISYGSRITLYSLDLVPGHPTRYRYGDEEREMIPVKITIEVLGESEPMQRTLWTTHYGPVITTGSMEWTTERAFTIRDATDHASGLLAHLHDTGRAASLDEFKLVHAKHQALPILTTIAVDADGVAWFAEAPSAPNLSNEALAEWRVRLESDSLTARFWEGRSMLLNGSDPLFEWQDDPAAGKPGVVPFHRMPQLERTDYVFNSNDSFWLANADVFLEGDYSPLNGPQRAPVSLRTRSNVLHITNAMPDSPAGEDGRFNLAELQEAAFTNRSLTADLLVPELVERCHTTPRITIEEREVDLGPSCAVLDRWDRRFGLESRGAVLFREWLSRYPPPDFQRSGSLFAVDFDPDDPVNTPRTLAPGALALENLAEAVRILEVRGIALDVPLGELQYAPSKLPRRIPVHGGVNREGVLNLAIPDFFPSTLEPVELPALVEGSRFLTDAGYPVLHGTSFIMALEYTDDGPRANALLTYGQSGDPDSEHFIDQTELFVRKEWRSILFRTGDVAAGTLRKYRVSADRTVASNP